MIYGIGTDIVEIERLRRVMERHPERFVVKVFTERERRRAAGMLRPEIYYAGRWAAKEAIAKALGVGFGESCGWLDIDIANDALGKPCVRLSGRAGTYAAGRGIERWHVSISHEAHYAVAMAVAERGESG